MSLTGESGNAAAAALTPRSAQAATFGTGLARVSVVNVVEVWRCCGWSQAPWAAGAASVDMGFGAGRTIGATGTLCGALPIAFLALHALLALLRPG